MEFLIHIIELIIIHVFAGDRLKANPILFCAEQWEQF